MKLRVRNSFLTLLAILFSASLSMAQLSGTYTIDPSGSGSSNYTSFSSAVSALNSNGVNGDVTFIMSSGTHTGGVSISAFSGSGSYDVVFRGAGKTSTTISSSSSSGVIRFTGGDNVTFRDLAVSNTSIYEAVEFTSSSEDCAFRNCALSNRYTGTSTSSSYAVVQMHYNAKRATFDSCDVVGGSNGFYEFASSSNRTEDLTISNCSIRGYYNAGVYLYYSYGTQILNNTFDSRTTYCCGESIWMYYANSNSAIKPVRINGNLFKQSTDGGIYLFNCDGYSTSSRNEMYNNVIQGKFSSSSPYPCYMSSCDRWNVYHNTIAGNVNYTSTTGACLYATGSYVDVQNNTFISSGNYLIYLSSSTSNEAYNNYYNWSGSGTIYIAGSSTYSSTSMSVHQGWSSLTDLDITDGCVNGTNLTATVGTDIDGTTRNNPPDIGAYEAPTANLDISVTEVLSPMGIVTSGSQTVTVLIKNFGQTSVTSANVTYQVGNNTPVTQSVTFTTALGNCDTASFTFGTTFSHTAGCGSIRAWTSSPNSSTDQVPSNDTSAAQAFGIPMAGTYTIGGTSGDYGSFGEAIEALNCAGISAPVIFDVAEGTYMEQVNVPAVLGASASRMVTFRSASSNTSNPQIRYDGTSSSDYHALGFEDASYIVFDGIDVMNKGASYATGVMFGGTCNALSVKNGTITSNGSSSSNSRGVYLNSNSNCDSIRIDGNTIRDCYYGIYAYNSSSTYTDQDWMIYNNMITNVGYYGMNLRYQDRVQVVGNTIQTNSSGYYGIYMYYCDGTNLVSDNRLEMPNGGRYGLYMYYCYGTSTSSPALIKNNFISVGNGSTYIYAGIRSGYSRNQHIYNNSVRIHSSSISTSYSAGSFYYNSSSYSGNEVKNNIFVNAGGGYALYHYSTTYNYIASDYNDIYGNTTGSFIYSGSSYSSLSAYSAARSLDGNSISADPGFYSATDLHATASAPDSAGTSLTSVTMDIDGQSRRASNPSIGADEYTALDHDAGVTSIDGPEVICTSNTATVTIKNFGLQNLSSVTINWSIDGVAQTPYAWTHSGSGLIPGASEMTNIGTFGAPSGTGPVNIEAWTSNPNTNTDLNNLNDSASGEVGRGTSGTFTIAPTGGDFSSFGEAADFIEDRGLCGPVVFNVKEGTYNEQLVLNPVRGASPTNSITFQADASNTSPVTIEYAAPASSTLNYVCQLRGVSNVTFDGINMTNNGTSTTYGGVLQSYRPTLADYVHNITVKNCTLKSHGTTTTSNYASIVRMYYGDDASPEYNRVENLNFNNCSFEQGSFACYIYGSTTYSSEHKNISFTNCTATDQYGYGFYFRYADTISLNNCDVTMSTTGSSSRYGIYLYYCDGGVNVQDCDVTINQGTSTQYGFYTRYCDQGLNLTNCDVMLSGSPSSQYGFYSYYCDGGIDLIDNKFICSTGSSSAHAIYVWYAQNSAPDTNHIINNFAAAGKSGVTNQSGMNFIYGGPSVFYHNNFLAASGATYSNQGSGATIYGSSSSHGPFVVMNNNFRHLGTTHMTAWINGSSTGVTSDYNNFTGPAIFMTGGSGYTTLAAYQTASGLDGNSMDINPKYTSATDLHVNNPFLHEEGTNVGVTHDIDNDTRDNPPTIGATEIDPDVNILSVTSDTICGHDRGDATITVTIKNDGDITFTDIPLSYTVDGGTAVNDVFSGPIAPGATVTETLTNKIQMQGMMDYTIKIWANQPDVNHSNDTATGSTPYWPYPVNGFTHKDTCYQDVTQFTNTSSISSGSIVSYSWNFGDGNSSSMTDPTNQYANSGSYTVTLASVSNNGCVDTITGVVNIMTELLPGSIDTPQTICYDFAPMMLRSVADASQSAGNYQYQWQMSTDNTTWSDITGANATTYAPGQLTTTTYYRRAVTTSIGCGPKYTASVKITVYDELMAGSIGTAQDICYNTKMAGLTQLTAPTGGDGTWTYRWEKSTNNSTWSVISGATASTYTDPNNLTTSTWYRRVDIGGSNCGEVTTNSVKINVYDPLVAGDVGPGHESCPNTAPDQIGVTTAPTGGDGTYTYQWQESTNKTTWTDISGETGTTYQEGVLTQTMHYRLKVTSGSGCGTRYSKVATIAMAAVPKASFAASNHCFNDVVPITNFSTIAKGSITKYFWDFNDGNVSADKQPTHQYQTDGTKTIKLVVTSNIGCTDSTERTLKVSNIPTPAFSYFYDCDADSLRFKNTTSVNCGKINAFYWDFGDGSSSTQQNPTHKYASSGTYNVKMKIFLPGGFIDSLTKQVSQYDRSTASFTTQDVCFGEDVKFTNTSQNAVSYEWDFDDNNLSKLSSPSHFYRVTGKYKVKLRAYDGNGCYNEFTSTVTVKVKPVAYFTTDNRCDGDSVPFFNGTTYAHTYSWDFGDNNTTTVRQPKHLYGADGKYDVTLYAFNNNGCKDTAYGTVNVWDLPTAAFNVADECDGETVTFNNTSTMVNQYDWTFGDGQTSTGRTPTHVYSKAGTYTVNLTITTTEGCADKATETVRIYDNPVADFSAPDVCLGNATSFTNNSTLANGSMSYSWNFGDGNSSTASNPSHTYSAAGTYTVTLQVNAPGGCMDVMSKTVKVKIQPGAGFSANTVCEGTATSFTNSSTNANRYMWSFGDGNTSGDTDPRHQYAAAGTYTVTLKVMNANGCESTTTGTVTVNAMPTAGFSASTVCEGNATQFTNSSSVSSGTMSYSWNFGDGNSSTSASPSHTYAAAGTYTAILTTTANGCESKASAQVTVNATPDADFTHTNVCDGESVNFSNRSSNADSYSWNFGDASSSTAVSPSHKYASASTYTVQLTASTNQGCSDSRSASVVVYAKPTVAFSQNNECVGNAMSFTNTSSSGTYYWEFGDGGTSTAMSPSHTYNKSGRFNVRLIVTNSFGCESELTQSVTVHPDPTPSFTATEACLGSATAFTNTSTGAASYSWDFGDGNSSSAATPSHTYASSGSFTVVLTATSTNGCESTYSSRVTVHANPSASFSASNVCLGNMMSFTNTSSTGASVWNFGDGSSSRLNNPNHMYASAGTYNVSLQVTNENGCQATYSRNVTVNALPAASFTSTALCTGSDASFSNTSTGASSYSWRFGDGNSSTSASPTHSYAKAGKYTVQLTATSSEGCSSSAQSIVTVYTAPVADFMADGVCEGLATRFTNMSTAAASSAWNFGDGNNSNNVVPTHTYASFGSYNVTLKVRNLIGCEDELTKAIDVYANPTASFTAANGCEGDALTFTNTSTGAASSMWAYGDGNTSNGTDGSNTYSGNGTRTITLTVTSANGCRDMAQQSIEVYKRPFAAFVISNTCEGDLTKFVNTSLNGSSYSWDFGDGANSTIANPTHQYASSGSYTASLTVNNSNCSDTYNMPFSINPAPDAGFTFNKVHRDVDFIPNSTTNITKYEWNFDDGSTSNEESPSHYYGRAITQVFNVCLRVTDAGGCSAESCSDVRIDIVGVKDVSIEGLEIYPNPTSGVLNIEVAQSSPELSITLVDMLGKTVRVIPTEYGVQRYSADISDLAEGVYLVKVVDGTKETSQRIILSK